MQADKQTISDIELFSYKRSKKAIFDIYNQTVTCGGSKKLHHYLNYPVTDLDYLEMRRNEISFFVNSKVELKLDRRRMDFIEHYLKIGRFPLRPNWIDAYADSIVDKLKQDSDYYVIREGIFHFVYLIKAFKNFIDDIDECEIPESLQKRLEFSITLLNNHRLAKMIKNPLKRSGDISPIAMNTMDAFIRRKYNREVEMFLDTVYHIDVMSSMASMVTKNDYSLVEYVDSKHPVFEAEECFHPLWEQPVCNDFSFIKDKNLCFLTGPNMSGKSTFLKTVGLLVYLAHAGFPVPASSLKLSPLNVLFTTINLADNLGLGFSHFYSEVRRVKEMAIALQSKERMLVIFDELFKGTNVKDAFDATLMVVQSLSRIENCFFFISSHILEVAEELAESNRIDFKCFESEIKNNKAQYDYRIKNGISEERIGYQIVKNENIENILNGIINRQTLQKVSVSE
ncbi:hypothetical protein OU798_04965 [Prolixibacteraceae bacterium Z1-6]|uniref:DNA mismatch repair proteins mutS family domain-containing protein n=1 Tax=Draconibacterium aestuarii TaxID=2998507 RepID=A0A9X3F379_9BACT|nr:hypothetical protein [Prolixibacteraceae bacterium Z1-6]